MRRTAILVDGGFYRKRANRLFGKKTPEDRADELMEYCYRHLIEKDKNEEGSVHFRDLYRIFYYDCEPSEGDVYNPVSKVTYHLKETAQYEDSKRLFKALSSKRKVALRMGELSDNNLKYTLDPKKLNDLCSKVITVDDLKESDLILNVKQKGVDMRIGLDIASLAHKKLVDQIVLISGDSDFVPAAKYARREGIDFILDPLRVPIKDSLRMHIDGLNSKVKDYPENKKDSLHVDNMERAGDSI